MWDKIKHLEQVYDDDEAALTKRSLQHFLLHEQKEVRHTQALISSILMFVSFVISS